jgi:transcriptional regulator PpsR
LNIASALSVPLRAPSATLGSLDATAAARLAEAAGDLVLILEPDGTVIDYSIASHEPAIEGSDEWVGRKWAEIVTIESRGKVEDMLGAVAAGALPRWRQVNHPSSTGDVPVRYWTVASGNAGRVIAVGRDLRANAVLQQRLMQVQQSLERDYLRLRQAESRYRMLFERAAEAILVVDAESRRIREANPAATRLLGAPEGSLVNRPLSVIADPHGHDALMTYLGAVSAADQPPMALQLPGGRGSVILSASVFRQDQASYYLVRVDSGAGAMHDHAGDAQMLDMLARMPDAFVLADADLNVVAANPAFIDLAQMASVERVRGTPIGAYIGRAGIDLDLIIAQIREHGSARNIATIIRAGDGTQEEVEVSAVAAPSDDGQCYGFSIRAIARRSRDLPPVERDLPRSVEQLTDLVGRMSLKEIVRESTDLIERLCIEAALAYTADNRASAAEILGVSRQSLYSKLHRHGLGNLGAEEE